MIREVSRWRIGRFGYRRNCVDIFRRWGLLVTRATTSDMHLTKVTAGCRVPRHQASTTTTNHHRRPTTSRGTMVDLAIIILRLTRTRRTATTTAGGRHLPLSTAVGMTGHLRLTTARRRTPPKSRRGRGAVVDPRRAASPHRHRSVTAIRLGTAVAPKRRAVPVAVLRRRPLEALTSISPRLRRCARIPVALLAPAPASALPPPSRRSRPKQPRRRA